MASGVSSIFGRPSGDASLATNLLREKPKPGHTRLQDGSQIIRDG
jgi:hypothetical protein